MGAAGLALILQLTGTPAIVIRLPEQDNCIAHLIPADTGDRFFLSYLHSVEKTRVKGTFQVSAAPAMLAVETRMTSVGTGLPNTFAGRTTIDGEWIVVDEELKALDAFRFFISKVNETVLETPGTVIDLMKLPSGTVITVGVEKVTLLVRARHYVQTLLTSKG